MIDVLLAPWPWYIGGPAIGIMVPLLLLIVGRPFGISSSFRHMCSAALPVASMEYLRNNDWRKESWSLVFVVGVVIGAWLATRLLSSTPVDLLPEQYGTGAGAVRLLLGGILVGFGTRYADGCTSGHSIMGISLLNWPSLVATLCFFAGGLLMIHVIL